MYTDSHKAEKKKDLKKIKIKKNQKKWMMVGAVLLYKKKAPPCEIT